MADYTVKGSRITEEQIAQFINSGSLDELVYDAFDFVPQELENWNPVNISSEDKKVVLSSGYKQNIDWQNIGVVKEQSVFNLVENYKNDFGLNGGETLVA